MSINRSKSKRLEYDRLEVEVEEQEAEREMDMERVETFKYLGNIEGALEKSVENWDL